MQQITGHQGIKQILPQAPPECDYTVTHIDRLKGLGGLGDSKHRSGCGERNGWTNIQKRRGQLSLPQRNLTLVLNWTHSQAVESGGGKVKERWGEEQFLNFYVGEKFASPCPSFVWLIWHPTSQSVRTEGKQIMKGNLFSFFDDDIVI